MKDSFVISITWGKSSIYLPASVEPICWDGCAVIEHGQLHNAEFLHFDCIAWCQAKEISEAIRKDNEEKAK